MDADLAVRVRLRQWRDEDREPFAQLSADPEVMRYFPSTRSREESDGFVDWASGLIAERGWACGLSRLLVVRRLSASWG